MDLPHGPMILFFVVLQVAANQQAASKPQGSSALEAPSARSLPDNANRLECHSYRSAVFKRDGNNALEYLLDIRLIFPLGMSAQHLPFFIKLLRHGHREQSVGV